MNAEVKSGSSLGRYELLTRLGRGGMASVWVAREKAPVSGKQRLVAVKAMLPELARHSDFRAMFLEEGQIVRSIDHPNVVKVHEVSEDRGILYMAMEWVEGDSLRTVIKEAKRRRAIPAEMAVKIIADTAAGLHAAHELRGWDGELRNIVHCDISPHNILVGLDGMAKLVDFGVANATVHSNIDAEDKIKGKFGYMSPEQASAGKVDRRSDVFALGIVLYELTTGERLFRGDDPAQTLELVKNGRIPPPKEVYPQYPDALAVIVKRALTRSVSERFQTADELRDALEHYLKDARIMVSHAGVGQLVKRVLGSRIEQQRQALREALTVADGTVVTGLVPDQSAAPERSTASASGVDTVRIGSPSDPPTSSSQYSSSRTGTPHPQTLEREQPRRASFLPLFAAIGGLAAAGSSIFWVTHRAAPAPLITTTLAKAPATSKDLARDNSVDPAGVNIDSLPTAGAAEPSTPSAEDMSNALAGLLSGHRSAPPPVEKATPAPVPVAVQAKGKDVAPVSTPTPTATPTAAVPDPPVVDPTPTPTAALPPPGERPPLNRGAAVSALNSAASAAMGCKRPDGPTGSGTATITFSPDGPVKSVSVSAPFGGTPVGQCVATVFRGARVPPFSGSSFTLPKGFQIPE
jgi:serine/threonine-protein kinase